MNLLDCGCGPGTITVGLAELVAPGRVVGVDFERGQVEKARLLAAERSLTTIDFAVADLFELPFSSHTFDAIFAHAVVQNIGDPMRALREMHRVLKPAGVIGVRKQDQGSNIYSPADPLLDQAHALYFKRWAATRLALGTPALSFARRASWTRGLPRQPSVGAPRTGLDREVSCLRPSSRRLNLATT